MSIVFSFQSEGDLLLVKASGADDNLDEVKTYGLAVVNAAIDHGCRRILCDERHLQYRLGTVDTFESAAFISSYVPRVVKVALVCSEASHADAMFWETVAVNRGLIVRVFRDIAQAQGWLDEEIPAGRDP